MEEFDTLGQLLHRAPEIDIEDEFRMLEDRMRTQTPAVLSPASRPIRASPPPSARAPSPPPSTSPGAQDRVPNLERFHSFSHTTLGERIDAADEYEAEKGLVSGLSPPREGIVAGEQDSPDIDHYSLFLRHHPPGTRSAAAAITPPASPPRSPPRNFMPASSPKSPPRNFMPTLSEKPPLSPSSRPTVASPSGSKSPTDSTCRSSADQGALAAVKYFDSLIPAPPDSPSTPRKSSPGLSFVSRPPAPTSAGGSPAAGAPSPKRSPVHHYAGEETLAGGVPEFGAAESKPEADNRDRQQWERDSWDPFSDPAPEAVRAVADAGEAEGQAQAQYQAESQARQEEVELLRACLEEKVGEAQKERGLREGTEAALLEERGEREMAEDALALAEDELKAEREETGRLRGEIGLLRQVGFPDVRSSLGEADIVQALEVERGDTVDADELAKVRREVEIEREEKDKAKREAEKERAEREEAEEHLKVTRRELSMTLEVLKGIEEEVSSLRSGAEDEVVRLREALLSSEDARRSAEVSARLVDEEVASLRKSEAGLKEIVGGLERDGGLVRGRVEELTRERVALEGLVEEGRAKAAETERALEEAQGKVGELERALEAEKEGAQEKARQLEEALGYAEEVARFHEEVQQERGAKEGALGRIVELEVEREESMIRVQEIGQEMDTLRVGLRSAEDDLASAKSVIEGLCGELDAIKSGGAADVGELRARLAVAEAELRVAASEWDTLQGEAGELRARLGEAETVAKDFERARKELDTERMGREEAERQRQEAEEKLVKEQAESAAERKRSVQSLLDLEALCESGRKEALDAKEQLKRESRRLNEENEGLRKSVEVLKEDVASLERIKLLLQGKADQPATQRSSRFRLMIQGSHSSSSSSGGGINNSSNAPPPPLADSLRLDIAAATDLDPSLVRVERVGTWYAAVDCALATAYDAVEEDIDEALAALVAQLGDSDSVLMRGKVTRGLASFELLPPAIDGDDQDLCVESSMSRLVRGSRRVNDIAEELASKTRMLIEEQEKTCQLEECLSKTMRLLEEERRVASQMRLQAAGELRNHNGSPMGGSMLSPRQQSERRGPLFSPRGGVIMNPDMQTEVLQLSPIKDSIASPRSGVLEFSPGQGNASKMLSFPGGGAAVLAGGAFSPPQAKEGGQQALSAALATCKRDLAGAKRRLEEAHARIAELETSQREQEGALEHARCSLAAKAGGGARVAIARVLRTERERAVMFLRMWLVSATGPLGGRATAWVKIAKCRRGRSLLQRCVDAWRGLIEVDVSMAADAEAFAAKGRLDETRRAGFSTWRVIARRGAMTKRHVQSAVAGRSMQGMAAALLEWRDEARHRRVSRIRSARLLDQNKAQRRKKILLSWRFLARESALSCACAHTIISTCLSSASPKHDSHESVFIRWAKLGSSHKVKERGAGLMRRRAERVLLSDALREWASYARASYKRVIGLMAFMGSQARHRARDAFIWWAVATRAGLDRNEGLLRLYARGRRRVAEGTMSHCTLETFYLWREMTPSSRRSEKLGRRRGAVACRRALRGWISRTAAQQRLARSAGIVVRSRARVRMQTALMEWRSRARRTTVLATVAAGMVKAWLHSLLRGCFCAWAQSVESRKDDTMLETCSGCEGRGVYGRAMWGWRAYVSGSKARRWRREQDAGQERAGNRTGRRAGNNNGLRGGGVGHEADDGWEILQSGSDGWYDAIEPKISRGGPDEKFKVLEKGRVGLARSEHGSYRPGVKAGFEHRRGATRGYGV